MMTMRNRGKFSILRRWLVRSSYRLSRFFWLVLRWSVCLREFVCAFVSAFVCPFRGLFACVLSWVEICEV